MCQVHYPRCRKATLGKTQVLPSWDLERKQGHLRGSKMKLFTSSNGGVHRLMFEHR